MEASWPPKKPESYFRTLRRLLDLLVCWGEGRGRKGRGEKGGKVAEIIYKMFKRGKKQAVCPENYIYNSDYTLYLYDYT